MFPYHLDQNTELLITSDFFFQYACDAFKSIPHTQIGKQYGFNHHQLERLILTLYKQNLTVCTLFSAFFCSQY